MFRAVICLTEQHMGGVVVLAALVCWVSNFIAFRLLRQASVFESIRRAGWNLAASFAVGTGIWSTHFIAMLGYDPGIVIGYDPQKTLFSFAIAVVSAFFAILIFDRARHQAQVASAGVVIGLGIAFMHYTGMAGVEIPGTFRWDGAQVAASVVAGCVLAPAALLVFARRMTGWPSVAAGTIMTLAIAATHFIGMGAAEAVPDPAAGLGEEGLPRIGIAIGIAVAMFATLAFAALALFSERLRQSNEELKAKTAQLDAALTNMPHGLCMFGSDNRVVVCNERYAALYGLPPRLTEAGTPFEEILAFRTVAGNAPVDPRDYREREAEAALAPATTAFDCELRDGRVIRISHRPMSDGGYVTSHEDITAATVAKAQIAHMAHHDALTDLPNRVLFRQRLDAALAGVRRGTGIAVLCLDLDQFKAVNDTLGHPIGDALLIAVTARLRSCVRETDLVARLGGDEFAIIQAAVGQPRQATILAERIIHALGAPFEVEGHRIVVGTSVGIALAPSDTDDADRLLKSADMALYRAKNEGRRTFRFFEAEMDARMQARRSLELDLRKAIPNGELEVHYQPIINVGSEKVSGFEALLRWKQPERGSVSPAEFIPLAEEIGLIHEIGTWVLKRACMDAVLWPDDVNLAVNVSAVQFKNRTLVLDVAAALGTSGLRPSRLEVEITETAMIQDAEATLDILLALRELGVRIALDDFGTGYSSLSYLRRFPFDKIKIDQSFVRDLSGPGGAVAIVRAVIGLAGDLGMTTTAEGVETAAQLEWLKAEGCTEVQGWLFSPARPVSEVSGLLSGVSLSFPRAA